jgi:hypothetical protein
MTDTEEASSKPGKKDEPLGESASAAVDSSKQMADLIQNFGVLLAPWANFGNNAAPGDVAVRAWLVKASGKLSQAESEAILRHFVRPTAYDEARAALHQDHVLVLEGNRGIGKFTAAIALLSERAKNLLILPPAGVRILSERKYDENTGYVVEGGPDEGSTAENAVTWRMLRDRVRDAKAYLVVTSTALSREVALDAVRRVSWSPPPVREVLLEYLPGQHDAIAQIGAEAGAGGLTMTELVGLARRVARGEPLDDVLREPDRVLATRVSDWFEEHPQRVEVLAMTALAFLAGAEERAFETHLARLERLVAEAIPLPEPNAAVPVPDSLPQRGRDRLDDTLVIRQRVHGLAASRTLAFRHRDYQRHVLSQLSDKYPVQFWDSVRTWLDEIVHAGEGPLVASGLAQLARVDFGEVRDQYLDPWSKGEQGLLGQIAATYVLWMMCYEEDTLPLALPSANRWASNGSPAQRWTAAIALSGELGSLYPAEAVRRLWELVKQSTGVGGNACLAFAGLFASLVDAEKNASAGQLLATMDWQRQELLRKANGDRHLRHRTISAIIEVLGVREVRGTRPAILRLLRAQPEHMATVGELWAYALRQRVLHKDMQITFRKRALTALRESLHALHEASIGTDLEARWAEDDARALAEAIADALPGNEIRPLIRDLSILEARSRNKPDEAFASILLTALDQHLRHHPAEE